MSIIINTNKDSGKHYLDIKRYLHSLLLSKKCSIEYYFYNFQKNNEIVQVIDNIYIGNYSSSTNKKLLLDNHFDSSEWIAVSRKLRENYRVSGKNGKLNRALPKNDFPKRIIDYINSNLYQPKQIEPKKKNLNHYIKKLKNKLG